MYDQQKVNQIISALEKPGLPEILSEDYVDKLFLLFKPILNKKIRIKINKLTQNTNIVSSNRPLLIKALNAEIEEFIKKKINSYLFINKKWENNTPIISYLCREIYFFKIKESTFANTQRKKSLTCPACSFYKTKSELLELSNKKLYCETCNEIILKNSSSKEEIELRNIFLYHSKKGTKCPKCNKFVPISLSVNGELHCPYPGCGAKCDGTNIQIHPYNIFYHSFKSLSLDNLKNTNDPEQAVIEKQERDYKINEFKKILRQQQKIQGTTRMSPNKFFMYNAIYNTLEKYPTETYNYIVKKYSRNNLPLQAIIYQTFAKEMLKLFPFNYRTKQGVIVNVTNPIDESANLFIGRYCFVGKVDDGLSLKKNTLLSTAKTKHKNPYVNSFIGHIINIYDKNNISLLDEVESYGFTHIKFKQNSKFVYPDDMVIVDYYAIPSHYSVKSMAHMQRIIKKLQQSCANRKL